MLAANNGRHQWISDIKMGDSSSDHWHEFWIKIVWHCQAVQKFHLLTFCRCRFKKVVSLFFKQVKIVINKCHLSFNFSWVQRLYEISQMSQNSLRQRQFPPVSTALRSVFTHLGQHNIHYGRKVILSQCVLLYGFRSGIWKYKIYIFLGFP